MDGLARDLAQAIRALRRRPGFTTVIVLTLALGIGANTAVFSVLRSVLLRPLPYPDEERLASLWVRAPIFDVERSPISPPEYVAFRDHSRSWEALAAYQVSSATVSGDGAEPERVTVASATWSLFPALGTDPLLGRTFTADEGRPPSAGVAVLSHGYWMRRYGGDPGVLGRAVPLDGEPRTVVGVMSPAFRFPTADVSFWLPLAFTEQDLQNRGNHGFSVVGRLRADVTLAAAEAELNALTGRFVSDPSFNFHAWHPVSLRSLRSDTVGEVGRALWVMFAAAALVLVIACVNVANLLLVRAEERTREVSVRRALGAGRRRLVSQLLVEGLALAAMGGVAGVVVAYVGVEALTWLAPAELPRLDEIRVDAAVLAFTAAVTLGAGLLFGLAPALHASRVDVQGVLREEGRSGSAGRSRTRFRQLLVASQAALAVVLLVAAGLLLQSFRRLMAVDPGFGAEGVVTASITVTAARHPDEGDVVRFYEAVLSRTASLPGVTVAGAAAVAPLEGAVVPSDIEVEGWMDPGDAPRPIADIQVATPGYFDAMDIGVLEGRVFDARDGTDAPLVAVVSAALAREYWAGRKAVGGRIRLDWDDQPFAEVVGVVEDVRYERLDEAPARGTLYLAHAQTPRTSGVPRSMTLTVRAAVEPASLVDEIRREVQAIDPSVPLYQVRTMERAMAESTATRRFSMVLQSVFALLALSLSAIGLYGVLAFSVARRTGEIGVRMALGAGRPDVQRMVLRQAMSIVAAALLVGLAGALLVGRMLGSLLFGVSAWDPVTYGGVVGVLVVVAIVASWIPSRRASGVDPVEALRAG